MEDNTSLASPTSEEPIKNPLPDDDTVVISVQTGFDGYRLKNYYLTNAFQGFVWMIFHFSVIYFFTFLLKNIALVGIFLGFANFVAFLIDIPLGTIQRYVSTKKLFIIGAISQLVAVAIFFGFIFKVFSIVKVTGIALSPDEAKAGIEWFFGNALNWVGVIVASVCYGLTKEINDVSTYGYILSRANPSEYGVILARTNITFGIGSLIGLLLSGVILSTSPYFAVVILGILVIAFLVFTARFFDNSLDTISMDDIESFRVSIGRWNKENVREYLVETVKKADIGQIAGKVKYLMLKPKQKPTGEKIPWNEVFSTTKREFRIIWEILSHNPLYFNIIWTITLVLIFGFWDTFASSFLLDFLDEVKPGWSYVLLAVIGVPGIVLQETASKIGQKVGMKTIGLIGLALSSVSLILMGILALGHPSPAAIIGVALINSLGYACGMSTGQGQFLDIYNRIYAKHQGLNEIDANASSGPMKVIQNLANVIGLVFGGLLLMLGFPIFFFIFGAAVTAAFVWTIMKKDEIVL